jgi:hypothetical protein
MTGHLIPTAKRGLWRSFRDFLAECWTQGKWEISDYRRQWREYREQKPVELQSMTWDGLGDATISDRLVCINCGWEFSAGLTYSNSCPKCTSGATWAMELWRRANV